MSVNGRRTSEPCDLAFWRLWFFRFLAASFGVLDPPYLPAAVSWRPCSSHGASV